MNDDVVIISVAEAANLFGTWHNEQEKYRGKKIVVVNKKRHIAVGSFEFIEMPIKVEETCSCCGGAGKIKIKF